MSNHNPWRSSLESCMTGDNYLRTSEYMQLIEELDDLYLYRSGQHDALNVAYANGRDDQREEDAAEIDQLRASLSIKAPECNHFELLCDIMSAIEAAWIEGHKAPETAIGVHGVWKSNRATAIIEKHFPADSKVVTSQAQPAQTGEA